MKKNRNIHSIFMRSFVLFSIGLIIIFILISVIIASFMDSFISDSASIYYAKQVFAEEYRTMDLQSLEKSGGWIVVLNEDFSVDYLSLEIDNIRFDGNLILDLISDGLVVDGVNYLGTVKRFVDVDGNNKIGIVCLPSEIIDVKYTITNMFEGRNEFVIVYLIVILTYISTFIILAWAVSRSIKTKFSNPISEINDGIESVRAGNYQITLSLDTIDEINNIKNAFNAMAEKLYELQSKVKSEEQNMLQLFSDLSHDLRTPLTVIQGYSQRLITSNEPIKNNSKYLRAIYKNTLNIAELLDVMLDYTVMNRESYIVNLVKNDICDILRDLIADKFLEFENYEMNVEISIPEETILLEMDTKYLKRAISNLLNNIISHNKKGTNLLVGLERNEKFIVIAVADDGIEIVEEIRERIFNPFVRGDGSRESGSHCGLGLSIAKKAVEIHNGSIKICQPYKRYTKAFIIEIPIHSISLLEDH